jgi:hypothetical protein
MNKNDQIITSILSGMSILTISLASITIAINGPFLRITLAQEQGEDLVEMEMDNGTKVSVANGTGMILGDGTHIIENSTMTMMQNGSVQSENAF